jgi:O-glycosyl hydrolase
LRPVSLLAATLAVGVCYCAQPLRFELNAAAVRAPVWGRGKDIPRTFFPEFLPALFSRTLRLDQPIGPGAVLEWVFTGDQGGITVRIDAAAVKVIQRYYDSFGLSEAKPPKARYPQGVWHQSEIPYSDELRTVTVELDHKLGLIVSINGRQALRQTCLLEVRRHQLALTPASDGVGQRLAGEIAAPEEGQTEITVNPQERHQAIYGFGGILSAPAYAQLSAEGRRRWWELVREYNLLLHREYPNGNRLKPDLSNFGVLSDATPHYYGDNFPNGEITDFEYIRKIRSLGGHVLFEFWELPPWARHAYTAADGKSVPNAPIVDEYVRAMVGYCRILREKTGAAPEVVGIQNEITQPAEIWQQMIVALRAGLDRAGFRTVRIHMPDSGNLAGGIRTAAAIQKSAEAWKAIDWAATHVYDFQNFFEAPDGYDSRIAEWRALTAGKPFLSTELTVNSSAYQSDSYRVAFAHAQLYHKNMALMDASALIYCWTLLDVEQPSFAATRSLFAVDRANGFVPAASSYQARVFGAFSRHLREGMVRVSAASSHADVLATAYQGAQGRRTMILINRSTAPQAVRIAWPGGAALSKLEIASFYQANQAVPLPARLVLQPGEIATLSTVR